MARLSPLIALVLSALLVSGQAQAQASDGEAMSQSTQDYFKGEKHVSGIGFMSLGAASVGLSGAFLAGDSDRRKGIAYVFLPLGVVELIVGAVVFFRTDAQVGKLEAQMADDPAAFREAEQARMKKVVESFEWLKAAEIVIFVVGVGVALTGKFDDNLVLEGIGQGMAEQAASIFVLDLLADWRAQLYVEALESFDPTEASAPHRAPFLSLSTRF